MKSSADCKPAKLVSPTNKLAKALLSTPTFMMFFLCHVQSKYMLTPNHWLGPP